MTTRAQLESEREALRNASIRLDGRYQQDLHAALTASIARVEALLSLDDFQCDAVVSDILSNARLANTRDDQNHAACLRTVADIVRRS